MNGKPTIFAVSSGSGRAGIAVIRVSGSEAARILESLAGNLPPARRAVVSNITSRDRHVLIDRGMVLYFKAPHTVTGEDLAEFHVHGSPSVVERLLLELSTLENARPAEPGEFTRRAFENERMDLVEVEGLADLLASETEAQRKLAMRQFSGEASSVYEAWHSELTGALAIIEASIDFADEDGVAAQAINMVRPRLQQFRDMLSDALSQSEKAALVRRGLRIVIAGAPNVGKSSLLNVLAGRKAAIVSEIAGTTRDVVEASLVINGLPVSLADTAGLRDVTDDAIEREGMLRSQSEIDAADILVWVRSVTEDSPALPTRAADITVFNKADLVSRESIQLRNDSEIAVSVKTGDGLEALRTALHQLVSAKTNLSESAVMVRVRHRAAIEESIRSLNDALAKADDALELMAEDVRKASSSLASITGRVGVEDFLGRIFSEFCIGK
jgi:tRNA modification GTPase